MLNELWCRTVGCSVPPGRGSAAWAHVLVQARACSGVWVQVESRGWREAQPHSGHPRQCAAGARAARAPRARPRPGGARRQGARAPRAPRPACRGGAAPTGAASRVRAGALTAGR